MVEYGYLVWYNYEIYEVLVRDNIGNVTVTVSAKNYSLDYSLNDDRLTIWLEDFVYEVTDADEISDFLDDVETLLTEGKILYEEVVENEH